MKFDIFKEIIELHPLNMLSIFVTLDVSNVDTSIFSRTVQFTNISFITLTELVTKLLIFKEVNELQFLNNWSILDIWRVLKFDISKYSNEIQPLNISCIFLRLGV